MQNPWFFLKIIFRYCEVELLITVVMSETISFVFSTIVFPFNFERIELMARPWLFVWLGTRLVFKFKRHDREIVTICWIVKFELIAIPRNVNFCNRALTDILRIAKSVSRLSFWRTSSCIFWTPSCLIYSLNIFKSNTASSPTKVITKQICLINSFFTPDWPTYFLTIFRFSRITLIILFNCDNFIFGEWEKVIFVTSCFSSKPFSIEYRFPAIRAFFFLNFHFNKW